MAQALVKDIIDEVQRLANLVSSKDRERTLEALNRSVQRYAQRYPWPSLKRVETVITNGTRLLVLPERVNKVVEISDLDNQSLLRHGAHFAENHGPIYLGNAAGKACRWREMGTIPVIEQPASDSYLSFSTPQSESFDCEIYGQIRDTTASGTALEFYSVRETISMDGTTQTTTNLYTRIDAITKERETSNRLDITAEVDSTLVSRILPHLSQPVYRQIEFESIPNAGKNLRLEYYTFPDRISSELQAVDPSLNLQYLTWLAVGDLHWIMKEQDAAQLAWRKAEDILTEEANKEGTFGDRDHSVSPHFTYFDLEDLDEISY